MFPSGQRGQTVNLLRFASVVRIHPLPPKKKQLLFIKSCFFFYPSRRLSISSAHEVRCISSAPLGLYITTHRHALSCGLMRYNTLCWWYTMLRIDDMQRHKPLILAFYSDIISVKVWRIWRMKCTLGVWRMTLHFVQSTIISYRAFWNLPRYPRSSFR